MTDRDFAGEWLRAAVSSLKTTKSARGGSVPIAGMAGSSQAGAWAKAGQVRRAAGSRQYGIILIVVVSRWDIERRYAQATAANRQAMSVNRLFRLPEPFVWTIVLATS